ncbi:hypothetical protein [Gimesia panareensis]|uniref:hypothetical protein n=1 Tax=Gimesia panareensis TaxID=2527978 RepID=UPI0011A524F7|nr:hypothetical protein [Gimesia panareensis]
MKDDTLLHRQVHPSWVQDGRITSQVFRPTPKDEKRLSVYDGDQISAENAWKHFTEELKHRSIGVMAVTLNECSQQELLVTPDKEPFPEHVVINFSNFSDSQIVKKSKRLKVAAEARDWQFQAGLEL